jgi:hypothetical protein
MGLSVEIVVSFNNHTFARRANPEVDRLALRGVGFVPVGQAKVATEYFEIGAFSISNLDYEDTTTVTVNLEVAGGRCNRTLGTTIVNVKRDLCPNFLWPIPVQTFQTPVELPAHVFTVEFGELQTSNVNFNLEVQRYLEAVRNDSAVIDLLNSTGGSDVFTTVRFEYHPVPTLNVDFSNTTKPKCMDKQAKAPQWVLSGESFTSVTVFAKEEFPGITACDDVVGNLTLSSYLGEDIPDSPFSLCRDGCMLELTADEITSNETGAVFRFNSRASTALLVGYPELFAPFTKSLFVRMPIPGHKDATLVCYVFNLSRTSSLCTGSEADCDRSQAD